MESPGDARSIAARARRVLNGTHTGRYTKRMQAHDILWLAALADALRLEFLLTAEEKARDDGVADPERWAQECFKDFHAEVLHAHADCWNEAAE